MDRNSKLLLLVLSVVLFVHSDAASTVSPNSTGVTKPTVVGKSSTGKTIIASSTVPTTKAPVSCNTGTCKGAACTNTSTTYASPMCTTGECVTEKTTTKGTDTYTFRCANKDCAADELAAPNGTTIFCCEQANCNTYAALNSATSVCNYSIGLCTGLILLLVKVF